MPSPAQTTLPSTGKRGHGPALTAVLAAIVFLVGVPSLVVRARGLRQKPPAAAAGTTADDLLAGEAIYQRNCAGCHQSKGQGKIRQYPPLVGSSWLVEDKATAIRVVLLGMRGPVEVDGVKYDNVMPNFGVNLPDGEVARVLTYTRSSWGNHGSPVSADDVARVRASLAARTEAWNGGAELEEARKTRVLP